MVIAESEWSLDECGGVIFDVSAERNMDYKCITDIIISVLREDKGDRKTIYVNIIRCTFNHRFTHQRDRICMGEIYSVRVTWYSLCGA